ncbi:hypothetical protein ACFQ1M_06090 [Sungkyunkwania multivorans]|uniref:Lipocalin-like domain-containing protein n=1 Tax=Sungkyunkwania multivorans TaxID=1173618 RepID=A0ABW3CY19_9FLAO
MKTILTIITLTILGAINAQEKLDINDFKDVLGVEWKGKLTYKNYSDGRMVNIDCTLRLEKDTDASVKYIQKYPYEPKANSSGKWKLQKDGTFFNKGVVISKKYAEDGSLEFTTRSTGKDNGKPSTFYMTYRIGKDSLSYKKEVKYDGTEDRFVRNKYEYARN